MSLYSKRILAWLLGTAFLIWLMVMLGGATRLTHAGLSIVEWKPVTGILPPLNHQEWLKAFTDYQQFPEYKLLNKGMTLNEFKFIFWMEFMHRFLGRLIGLFFLIPFVVFWHKGYLSTLLKRRGLQILLLGFLQGVIGWYMVKSGLVKDPSVSHYRLTLHLGMAFYLFGLVLWTACDYSTQNKRTEFPYKPSLLYFTFCLQLLAMCYGGFVAGLKAGLIYNTFPLMEGQWIPAEWNFYRPVWINFFENAAFIQWLHRILALLSLGTVWIGWIKYRHSTSQIFLLAWAITTSIQVLLGITTLLYQVPVTLGTIHQGWAVVVLAFGLLSIYPNPLFLPLRLKLS